MSKKTSIVVSQPGRNSNGEGKGDMYEADFNPEELLAALKHESALSEGSGDDERMSGGNVKHTQRPHRLDAPSKSKVYVFGSTNSAHTSPLGPLTPVTPPVVGKGRSRSASQNSAADLSIPSPRNSKFRSPSSPGGEMTTPPKTKKKMIKKKRPAKLPRVAMISSSCPVSRDRSPTRGSSSRLSRGRVAMKPKLNTGRPRTAVVSRPLSGSKKRSIGKSTVVKTVKEEKETKVKKKNNTRLSSSHSSSSLAPAWSEVQSLVRQASEANVLRSRSPNPPSDDKKKKKKKKKKKMSVSVSSPVLPSDIAEDSEGEREEGSDMGEEAEKERKKRKKREKKEKRERKEKRKEEKQKRKEEREEKKKKKREAKRNSISHTQSVLETSRSHSPSPVPSPLPSPTPPSGPPSPSDPFDSVSLSPTTITTTTTTAAAATTSTSNIIEKKNNSPTPRSPHHGSRGRTSSLEMDPRQIAQVHSYTDASKQLSTKSPRSSTKSPRSTHKTDTWPLPLSLSLPRTASGTDLLDGDGLPIDPIDSDIGDLSRSHSLSNSLHKQPIKRHLIDALMFDSDVESSGESSSSSSSSDDDAAEHFSIRSRRNSGFAIGNNPMLFNLREGKIRMTALVDFEARNMTHLSFKKGDVLVILEDKIPEDNEAWIKAERNGMVGFIPINCLDRNSKYTEKPLHGENPSSSSSTTTTPMRNGELKEKEKEGETEKGEKEGEREKERERESESEVKTDLSSSSSSLSSSRNKQVSSNSVPPLSTLHVPTSEHKTPGSPRSPSSITSDSSLPPPLPPLPKSLQPLPNSPRDNEGSVVSQSSSTRPQQRVSMIDLSSSRIRSTSTSTTNTVDTVNSSSSQQYPQQSNSASSFNTKQQQQQQQTGACDDVFIRHRQRGNKVPKMAGNVLKIYQLDQKLSLQDWAERYWVNNTSLSRMKGKEEKTQAVLSLSHHSPSLLRHPLNEMTLNSKAMKEVSLKTFKSISGYMLDRNSSKEPLEHSQNILRRGIQGTAAVRTEIYCQILKQSRKNPNPESIYRSLSLLSLCCSVFPPSPSFLPTLVSELRQWVEGGGSKVPLSHLVAKYSLERLSECVINGSRENVPLPEEISAIENRLRLSYPIYEPLNTSHKVQIGPQTRAIDIISSLSTKLRLDPLECAGYKCIGVFLNVLDEKTDEILGQRTVSDRERVMDVLTMWPQHMLSMSKQGRFKGKSLSFQLVVRPRYVLTHHIASPLSLSPSTLSLFFKTSCADVLSGLYQVELDLAIRLASLHVYVSLSTQDVNPSESEQIIFENLEIYFPPHMLLSHEGIGKKGSGKSGKMLHSIQQQRRVISKDISKAHIRLWEESTREREAQWRYIHLLHSSLSSFSSSSFTATYESCVDLTNNQNTFPKPLYSSLVHVTERYLLITDPLQEEWNAEVERFEMYLFLYAERDNKRDELVHLYFHKDIHTFPDSSLSLSSTARLSRPSLTGCYRVSLTVKGHALTTLMEVMSVFSASPFQSIARSLSREGKDPFSFEHISHFFSLSDQQLQLQQQQNSSSLSLSSSLSHPPTNTTTTDTTRRGSVTTTFPNNRRRLSGTGDLALQLADMADTMSVATDLDSSYDEQLINGLLRQKSEEHMTELTQAKRHGIYDEEVGHYGKKK